MSLKFEYDINADRMKVELCIVKKKCFYWVTRRQWLNMLARLQNLDLLPLLKAPVDPQEGLHKSVQGTNSSHVAASILGSIDESEQAELKEVIDENEKILADGVSLKSINIVKLDERLIRVALIVDYDKCQQLNASFTINPKQAADLSKQMYSYSTNVGWEIEYALKRITFKMRSNKKTQNTLKKYRNNQNRYH